MQSVGQQLTSVGGSMTALGAPFLAFGVTAVMAASEAENSVAQLDAVLKSTGGAAGLTRDKLLNMSSALQRTTRYGDEATQGAEALLLTFTNIHSDVFPQTLRATLDLSTAMHQDLKSSAVQLGKALNDPTNGMTALTRVGVTFTQAQKDQIKAMQDAGNLAGAQAVILAELQKEFGGSAEAAGKTFAGSLDILKNRFGDLQETIGNKLIPIIQEVAGWLGGLIDWFNGLDPSIQNVIIGVGAFMASLAVIGPIIAAIGVGISALGGVLGFILSPIGLVVAAVVGLVAAFQTNFLGIRDTLQPVVNAFQNFFAAIQAGVPIGDALRVLLFNLFPAPVATQIISAFASIGQFVTGTVLPALGQLADWFINTALPAVVSFVQTTVIPGIQGFINLLVNIWTTIQPGLQSLWDWFVNTALPAVVNFVTNTVIPGVQSFIDTLVSIWTSIQPGLQQVYDWFVTNGLPFVQRMIQGTIDNVNTVINVISGIWNAISPALTSVFDWFTKTGLPAIQSALQWFNTNVIQPVSTALSSLFSGINNVANGITNSPLVQGASNLLSGVGNFLFGPSRDVGGVGIAGMPYSIGTGQADNEIFVPRSNGTFIPDFMQNLQRLSSGGGNGGNQITIQFMGNGGPTNEQQADDAGYMLVNSLRKRGVMI